MKDLLAIPRLAENPRGRLTGFRVGQLIPGIGPATAARLLDAMCEPAEPQDMVENVEAPTAAAAEWLAFTVLYRAVRTSGMASGYVSCERFLTELTLNSPGAAGDRPASQGSTRTPARPTWLRARRKMLRNSVGCSMWP